MPVVVWIPPIFEHFYNCDDVYVPLRGFWVNWFDEVKDPTVKGPRSGYGVEMLFWGILEVSMKFSLMIGFYMLWCIIFLW